MDPASQAHQEQPSKQEGRVLGESETPFTT